MKIMLESFTHSGTHYEVDKDAMHCSCPAFTLNGHCKHLAGVGIYKQRHATLTTRPNYSQALSALVKSIRLRDINEGAYWLNYCWSFNDRLAGSQFRTVRRLLIGSSEDGHSIAVMEKMAANFPALLSKQVALERVLAELIRICKVPNWWNPDSGGHDYIHCGMLAMRKGFYSPAQCSLADCLSGLVLSIDQQDKVGALYWTMAAHGAGKGAGLQLAQKLYTLATERNCTPALRLMKNVYLPHAKSLSADSNFTCQAAWFLAGGVSPVIDQIETVTLGEIRQFLDKVRDTSPYVVPEWCCDGIHCAGNDLRYAGMWDRMFAVCNQFRHYGRVSPVDEWLEPKFYSVAGLKLEGGMMSEDK